MSDSLLPCPFCGGEAITPTNWGDPSRPIPRCRDCRAEAPSPEAWNRRTPDPDVARLLEACRVALGALMNGSTDTQRHAAFHHLRGAMKAAEQEAAQPE